MDDDDEAIVYPIMIVVTVENGKFLTRYIVYR